MASPADITGRRRRLAGAAATALLCGLVLWHFHDHGWYPPDDGSAAHIAQRLAAGEVLHRQVQDIHPGYVHLVNRLALGLFGPSLASLRLPLVLVGALQAGLLFLLLARWSVPAGAVGALALTALGPVQFFNPTAHWYGLALVVALIVTLARGPAWRWRLPVVGLLLGVLLLSRQLTGVLVAMGVLAFLLAEGRGQATGRALWPARALVAVMAAGLAFYLSFATDVAGWLMFGIWPLLLLGHLWLRARMEPRHVKRMLAGLAGGAAIAVLPWLTYHVLQGSLGAAAHDLLGRAVALSRLQILGASLYGRLPVVGLALLGGGTSAGFLNGFYWLMVPLLAAGNGWLLLRRRATLGALGPLPVLAVFHAVVSVHFQILVYLYFSAGLSLASVLWLTADGPRRPHRVALAGGLFLTAVALVFHAGQPLSRGTAAMLAGRRLPTPPSCPLPRLGLRIPAAECARTTELVTMIQRESQPGEPILALPTDAQWYFLAERRNAFRFFNTALAAPEDLRQAERGLAEHLPGLVIYNRTDKYNGPASERLMTLVRAGYVLLHRQADFEIYRRP